MPFYERLLGLQEPKIPVHQFQAAVNEVRRGHLTKAEVAALFQLDAQERVDAAALVDRLQAVLSPVTGDELHDVLMLAERRLVYSDVVTLKARLGVA